MKHSNISFALLLTAFALLGCQASPPKAAPPQPSQGVSSTAKPVDCAAIADPAQREDCRFSREVEADKKKHSSMPVVKHSPGSIQQP